MIADHTTEKSLGKYQSTDTNDIQECTTSGKCFIDLVFLRVPQLFFQIF